MAAESHNSLSFVYDNLTLFLIFVTTLIITYYLTRRGTNDPPGPPLWPIFGNLFSMVDRDLFRKLSEIRQQYGDVFSLYIGSDLWVFLNGYDTIHDALVKKGRLFSGRPISNFTKQFGGDLSAIVMENGTLWKERRALLVLALREVCFSNNGKYIEEIIQGEISHFMKDINPDSESSVTTDPRVLLSHSFLNIIVTMLHGRRLGNDHEDISMLVRTMERGSKIYFRGGQILSNLFPFMHWSVWRLLGVVDEEGNNRIFDFQQRMISQALEEYEEGREQCFVHHYMKVLKSSTVGGKPVSKGSFDMDIMKYFVPDITFAGSETSATTIKWILLYMVLNNDLQERLQREIDDNVPRGRLPSLSDRSSLPRTVNDS